MSVLSAKRIQILQSGIRLQAVSLGWMLVEAGVSIVAGIAAGSLLLIAFGIDSVIELISAGVLYWRLRKEADAQLTDAESVEAVERKASRIAGYLLYALSLYVVGQAIYGLVHRHQAQASWAGIAVALVAAFGMPVLARAKIRVADAIGSRAMRADAMETFTCGYLSWILLGGLIANVLHPWWWLDSTASLVLVPMLIKEAQESISGDCKCGKIRV